MKKQTSLNLGKELSKNELKKIMGGTAHLTCSDGNYYVFPGTCSQQMAYCAAAGHGHATSCY